MPTLADVAKRANVSKMNSLSSHQSSGTGD